MKLTDWPNKECSTMEITLTKEDKTKRRDESTLETRAHTSEATKELV